MFNEKSVFFLFFVVFYAFQYCWNIAPANEQFSFQDSFGVYGKTFAILPYSTDVRHFCINLLYILVFVFEDIAFTKEHNIYNNAKRWESDSLIRRMKKNGEIKVQLNKVYVNAGHERQTFRSLQ